MISGKKILIIDDDADTHEIIRRNLTPHGYRVISAFNGDEAIHCAKAYGPKLILLDLSLPGKKGEELYSLFENLPETKDVPVIIISAQGLERTERIACEKKLDRNDVFPKPINFDLLTERIEFYLGKQNPFRHRMILIADDDVDTSEIIRKNMEGAGYESVAAFSGLETINSAKKYKLDLILLDINMPYGDGELVYTVLKNMKSTKDIPIIIISGQDPGRVKDMHLANKIDTQDIFLKPIDFKALHKRITTHFSE